MGPAGTPGRPPGPITSVYKRPVRLFFAQDGTGTRLELPRQGLIGLTPKYSSWT